MERGASTKFGTRTASILCERSRIATSDGDMTGFHSSEDTEFGVEVMPRVHGRVTVPRHARRIYADLRSR